MSDTEWYILLAVLTMAGFLTDFVPPWLVAPLTVLFIALALLSGYGALPEWQG